MGFRVWGLGFRVWGLGFRVWDASAAILTVLRDSHRGVGGGGGDPLTWHVKKLGRPGTIIATPNPKP